MTIRKTKIIATIGPASATRKHVKALIDSGVDIFRINTSHSGIDGLRTYAGLIQSVSHQIRKPVSILVDLQGPRIRTGFLEGHLPVKLRAGEAVSVVTGKGLGNSGRIFTPFRDFGRLVSKNDHILIDNGSLCLKVLRSGHHKVDCRIVTGGLLGENKGINLPNAPLDLPSLSDRDRKILDVACKLDIAFVALSFVRRKEDMLVLRKYVQKLKRPVGIIAKIEKPVALERLDEILAVSDGVMVARGDLGIEMGVEKVPQAQKTIVERAGYFGVPVIVATQMLESMMEHPSPTRAEASDVANAVFDGSDAVMLSGETASGRYPGQAVRFMVKIIHEAERNYREKEFLVSRELRELELRKPIEAVTHAAYDAANRIDAEAIVAFTRTGQTAAYISRLRPRQPVFALTPETVTYEKLRLYWGVVPLKMKYAQNTDGIFREGEKILRSVKSFKAGKFVVAVLGEHAGAGIGHLIRILKTSGANPSSGTKKSK